MSAIKSFFGMLWGLIKSHPVLFFLVLFLVVVFGGFIFVALYRAIRSGVEKVSPAAANIMPVK